MPIDKNVNEFDINARGGNSIGIADGRSTMARNKCVSTIAELAGPSWAKNENENHVC
jgi:hypothetical protein